MKKLVTFSVILFASLLFLAGCTGGRLVVRDRPVAPVELRPLAPSPRHIWVNGNYIRSGRSYNYQPGYWAAPGRSVRTYGPGYWAPARRGYYWHRGRRF